MVDSQGEQAVLVLHHAWLLQTPVFSDEQYYLCTNLQVMTEMGETAIDDSMVTGAVLMHSTESSRLECCSAAGVVADTGDGVGVQGTLLRRTAWQNAATTTDLRSSRQHTVSVSELLSRGASLGYGTLDPALWCQAYITAVCVLDAPLTAASLRGGEPAVALRHFGSCSTSTTSGAATTSGDTRPSTPANAVSITISDRAAAGSHGAVTVPEVDPVVHGDTTEVTVHPDVFPALFCGLNPVDFQCDRPDFTAAQARELAAYMSKALVDGRGKLELQLRDHGQFDSQARAPLLACLIWMRAYEGEGGARRNRATGSRHWARDFHFEESGFVIGYR